MKMTVEVEFVKVDTIAIKINVDWLYAKPDDLLDIYDEIKTEILMAMNEKLKHHSGHQLNFWSSNIELDGNKQKQYVEITRVEPSQKK